jgi:hypothetical protein
MKENNDPNILVGVGQKHSERGVTLTKTKLRALYFLRGDKGVCCWHGGREHKRGPYVEIEEIVLHSER